MNTVATKAVGAAKLVATPVTMLGGVAHQHALKKLAVTDGALADKINHHNAAGTDLAAMTTQEFVELQFRLFPYRTARFADEWAALTANNGEYVCNYVKTAGLKEWVMMVRFFVRLLFCFMFGIMFTRQSILPHIAPDSPLVPGVYEHHNPNH
mmetsp:Transcript_19096/g.59282  ORF Transcript_19096/g.59282 Transcript_19096/m.59282 type:complete len:153 (-) Transcript_19096:53-511(-)